MASVAVYSGKEDVAMSEYDKLSEELYDEACRIVGQCCFMLADNGENTDRKALVQQLKRLHWKIMEQTGESNISIKLAIEQLSGE